MRRILLSCLFIFATLQITVAQDSVPQIKNDSAGMVAGNNSDFEKAITAYSEGYFRKTIELLEAEKDKQSKAGLESPELYYNLGNAYFRVNDMAHARLNYERALLLDPGDRDTRHNIDYMLTKIEDKILIADTFFLNNWFNAAQSLFSSDTWAIIGVASFLVVMMCLTAFFFSRHISIKKITFYIGIVLIVVVIFANVFAFGQKSKVENRSTAVIMAGSTPILSSPDINGKELTTLHAGTKVAITKEDRNWLEIEIDNGSIGWVQREKLEII